MRFPLARVGELRDEVVSVGVGGAFGKAVSGVFGGDDGGKTGFDALADQLGFFVIVQVAHLEQDGSHARNAARLAGALALEDVQHLISRNSPGFDGCATVGAIAGMLGIEVVGNATADGVVFNAADDPAAALQGAGLAVVQVVRLQHLKLERHDQPILRAAFTEADEALARLEHAAHDQRLDAVEIEQSIGVALIDPARPGLLCAASFDGDASADDVGNKCVAGAGGVGVVSHQCAGAVTQTNCAAADFGIGRG